MGRFGRLNLLAAAIACGVGLQILPATPAAGQFEAEYARLKLGRTYSREVKTGALKRRHGAYAYWLVVPASYDPAKKYQVRVQLHGGVMREDTSLRGDGTVRLAGAEQIYIMPAAWNTAPWWSDAQVASLRAILEDVKREYNVDENRVVLSGVSDGGTGAFFVAMRDTTPYASILPLNAYVLVLRNAALEIRGSLFLNNLRNKPFYIVNGGKDPLYPIAAVEPSIGFLAEIGVPVVYRPRPEAGHDTSWWPALKDDFETFVTMHPRVPLPDKLTWEVSDTRTWNRAHWLVIDAVGATPTDAKLDDPNLAGGQKVFPNARSGRVDLARNGNTIVASTRGVKEFTVLLSPDQFDFSRNIAVHVNGRIVFDARVEKNVEILRKWAARDNDRSMLFGAEVKIRP